ncbi:MAG: RsmE family RNA methyltransferase, partial [Kiritimatiellae bacterium]|nr:RsmE family RNA methyltransferase [Kiritimatiellia bacterium]
MALERQGDVIRRPPPRCRLILCACISKGKRMEWTIEKAVELGVAEILPIASDNSVVRMDEEGGADKRERWTRIAVDAARQCGTAWVPEIAEPMPLDAVLKQFATASDDTALFAGALQQDAIPMRDALSAIRASGRTIKTAGWFVGP